MPKVAVQITNTKHGLHKGHKEIINYAKSIGETSIFLIEDIAATVHYLKTGVSKGKYNINAEAVQEDCDKLGIPLYKPIFVDVSNETREEAVLKASSLIELFRPYLQTTRFDDILLYSLALKKLNVKFGEADYLVCGPEIPFFFLQALQPVFGIKRREIYPHIIKDEFGLKASTSLQDIDPEIRSRLPIVINGMRPFFKVGRNDALVEEINYSYPPTVGWRVKEIIVYEKWPVKTRLEVISFLIQMDDRFRLVEHVEYYE